MATKRFVLFQLGTLFFVVLVLMLMPTAHGKKGSGILLLYGTARCKSNPSRTINNATLQVTINGTMVATGETNRAGRFLLVANITSRNQLVALTRKEATITAPPGACGGVPATTAGRKLVAAAADLSGGSDDDDDDVEITDLAMMILSGDFNVDQLIDDILNSPPPVDYDDLPAEIRQDIVAFRESIMAYIDMNPETTMEVEAFLDSIGQGQFLLDAISNFLGIPPPNN